MNHIRQVYRSFLFLMLSGCLLGSGAGHVQALTITPAAPEAYQPFTLDQYFECTTIGDLDVIRVHISTGTDTIHLDADVPDACFTTPPAFRKVANVPGLPGGTYSIRARVSYVDPVEPPEIGSVVVNPAPPAQPVFAFYNESIRHYFITAGTAEKDSLLSGGGGGGWYLGDEGFNAWPADGRAPAAAKPVCRFYSSLVNSHFYTAGAGECEMLKQPAHQGLLLSRHHAGVAAVQRSRRPGRQQPPLRGRRGYLPAHDRQRLDRRGRGVLLAGGLTKPEL